MWVPLIFVILLLAIVFFQSAQGLFGAMIMMVLTLCCAAFAFGSYEWAAAEHMSKYWKPNMAHAISLGQLMPLHNYTERPLCRPQCNSSAPEKLRTPLRA